LACAREAAQAHDRAIVDPITLFGLVRMGIAAQVKACFADLGIVQTAIDLLRQFVHDREQMLVTEGGHLGWDGERYRMVEFDDAYRRQQVLQAREVLSFAEQLTLLPAEASIQLEPRAREVFESAHPAFLDTIYAASGDNRLFLSDDLIYRQIAVAALGIKAAWTQAVTMSARDKNKISNLIYFEIVGGIAEAHYGFTTINQEIILHHLRSSDWNITPKLHAFADIIASPRNLPQSIDLLLTDVLLTGWPVRQDSARFVDFLACIFSSFKRLHPTRDLAVLAKSVFTIANARLRLNCYQIVLKSRLLDCSAMIPASSIITDTNGIADEMFAPIKAAVEQAIIRSLVAL
jgi:hypothetical protein